MAQKSSLFSKISNTLLSIVCTFLLFYIWSISSTKKVYTSIIVSITITLTIHSIIIYILYHKYKKSEYRHTTLKKIEYYKTQLLYGSYRDIKDFFSKIFVGMQCISNVYLDKNMCIGLLYHKECISIDDILPIYKTYSPMPITILCISCNSDTSNIISNYALDITIYNLTQTIEKYFVKYTPDFHITISKPKKNIQYILSIILDRSKVKGYIFTSIFILLYTIYMPYKILYISLSTILLSLAIISLFINTKKHLNL